MTQQKTLKNMRAEPCDSPDEETKNLQERLTCSKWSQCSCRMGVSWNRGTAKSSILMGSSIKNPPFWIPSWLWNRPYVYNASNITTLDPPLVAFFARCLLIKFLFQWHRARGHQVTTWLKHVSRHVCIYTQMLHGAGIFTYMTGSFLG